MSNTAYGIFVIESHYEYHTNENIHGMWRDNKGTCNNKEQAIKYLNETHNQGIVTSGCGKIVHIKINSNKSKPSISYHYNKKNRRR